LKVDNIEYQYKILFRFYENKREEKGSDLELKMRYWFVHNTRPFIFRVKPNQFTHS